MQRGGCDFKILHPWLLYYNAHVLLPRVFLFKLNTEIMKLILFAFCFLFGKNNYGESFTKLLEDNR